MIKPLNLRIFKFPAREKEAHPPENNRSDLSISLIATLAHQPTIPQSIIKYIQTDMESDENDFINENKLNDSLNEKKSSCAFPL